MAVVPTTPGGSNTFIPGFGGSGSLGDSLVIDFSRNPKKFMLPRWAQYVPSKLNVGRYVKMTVEEAGRVLNSNNADNIWSDGKERPLGTGNNETFGFHPYQTIRYSYNCNVGKLASEQAVWDVVGAEARRRAQQAMTKRTNLAVTAAQTTGNYDSSHTAAVTGLGSIVTGKWDVSTTARLDIKKSIDYAVDVIRKDTLGVVSADDMVLVVSPGCARKMAASQELADFVKGSPAARDYIEGKMGPSAAYGLPKYYSNVEIVVEDAVKVTSRKGATRVASYVADDTKPFLCSRPGGLEGVAEAPSFSTITVFLKEDMTVEQEQDSWNRLTKCSVTDDVAVVVTASVSGFLFTAAVAA